MHAQELVIDYRVIKQQVYFNGARQSDITFWQNLFTESGFNLLAIDVAPIALRYVARNAGYPMNAGLFIIDKVNGFGQGQLANQLIITIYKIPIYRHFPTCCPLLIKKKPHLFTSLQIMNRFLVLMR